MSNKSLFSLTFIIGAATGSVATWYLLKDKYEALAQEEIDSVKEVFLRREQELKDQSVKKTVAEGIKDADKEKPDLKEYAERLKKEGYTRYSDFGSDEEEKPVSEAGPYVIPPEQFGDDEEYEQISLTLLRNGKTTNILNCLDKNADWFQLAKGDNIFAYTAEYGSTNLQFKIENRIVYEGV